MNRLAFSQGHELAPHGGTAVAVTPGWLRSEMMLDAFGVTEENWRDALAHGQPRRASRRPSHRGTSAAPSPRSPPTPTGSLEPAVGHRRQLAGEYGFTDVDGTQPDAWSVI